MTHETDDATFETSDAARIKRGWRTADAWLAALLALVGLAGRALPPALALSRHLRLEALRKVRRLEALVRRLTLAMAADTDWTDRLSRLRADPVRPPPQVTRIPLASLGLARHWRPDPAPDPRNDNGGPGHDPAPRRPVSPTIRLLEAWPDMRISVSDRPFDRQVARGPGPRIRNLWDAPVAAAPQPGSRADAPPDNQSLLRRLGALRAVIADPSRMVGRMRRWLALRPPRRSPGFRPSPLCIGAPRLALDGDARDAVLGAQSIASSRILRRDSG